MNIKTELNIGDEIYIIYDKDYYEIEKVDFILVRVWGEHTYITYQTENDIEIDEADELHNGKYCTSLKEAEKVMAEW